ncbi:MAG: outer membrane protein assembly factor BamE [Sutterellaceae bacterium]|nr:outer membrane protein assembly factor BamE [Burkholderiaceae bacterium]MDW8430170.1 outer membrane protein assembly factor BamE [Sutterellaceae bacterium]
MHRLLLLLLAAASLGGCEALRTWTPGFVQPYRPDVQQGNVVTQEMVEQLQQGMTRDQVRFLLGTPLLTSVFHRDRWDYVYYLQRGKGNERQLRRLTVYFENDRLQRVESDPMPPEKLADNLILGRRPKAVPQPPPQEPQPQITIPTTLPTR